MDDQIKILYLFPHKLYESKMSPGRRWYGQALSKITHLKMWGIGWPGYDSQMSLSQNLLESGFTPDAIWIYKSDGIKGLKECPIPKFATYNECWQDEPGRALKEVENDGLDMVICHHENDMKLLDGYCGKIHHIPHGAPSEIFHCTTPLSERQNGVLLAGVQSKEIYPLRHRYRVLAQSGAFPCKIRNHPGYRLPGEKACDQQAIDYANDLKSSKISLCCTSKHKYLLAKIIESMLAGCIVVTDEPDDSEFEEMSPYVVTVPKDATDEWIVSKINNLLSRVEDLNAMARLSQSFAASRFTTDHYAKRLLACISEIV